MTAPIPNGMGAPTVDQIGSPRHCHVVEFYETDAFLAATVADFLSEGLARGEAAIIVTTGPHRQAFIDGLRERGVDVDVGLASSRLVMLDAGELLARFMGDGGPDPSQFRRTVSAVMDRVCVGSRAVRVYGEMVAVLWADGQSASAIALEGLWNDLAAERDFTLLCAYPVSAFDDPADAAGFAQVCEQHTDVIPSEGYARLPRHDEGRRRNATRRRKHERHVPLDAVHRGPRWQLIRELDHAERSVAAPAVARGRLRRDWRSVAERRRIFWPSIVTACLPFVLVWLPPARWNLGAMALAGVLTLAIAVVALGASWERLPKLGPCLIAFLYLFVIVVLRVAGGPSGVAPLVLLPVFWLALYGTRRQLWCLLVGVALVLFLPLWIGGSAAAAPGAWRAGILLLAVSGFIGSTLESVAARLRAHERERGGLLAELADLAHTDSLTGVPNRRAWEDELDRALARASSTGESLSVALIDIDSFKVINDVHGHPAGDRLLIGVARRWSEILHGDGVLARIGGDEFAVLLPACSDDEAAVVLQRLAASSPPPYRCSVGHATWNGHESGEDLMSRADDALYETKRQRVHGGLGAVPKSAGSPL